jgi:hypothetical protein
MSGPIVRKYGFPNFEKIFGERPLQHGVDESEQPEAPAGEADNSGSQPKPAVQEKRRGTKKAKKP